MKQPKLKTCSFCHKDTVLWKANPKACKTCWQREQAKVPKENKSRSYSSIKPVSHKQSVRLRGYRKLRDEYMKIHPQCEAKINEICTTNATDLHHQAGRIGDLLTDTNYFMSLCRACHSYIETQPEFSKKHGYSVTRLDKQ